MAFLSPSTKFFRFLWPFGKLPHLCSKKIVIAFSGFIHQVVWCYQHAASMDISMSVCLPVIETSSAINRQQKQIKHLFFCSVDGQFSLPQAFSPNCAACPGVSACILCPFSRQVGHQQKSKDHLGCQQKHKFASFYPLQQLEVMPLKGQQLHALSTIPATLEWKSGFFIFLLESSQLMIHSF